MASVSDQSTPLSFATVSRAGNEADASQSVEGCNVLSVRRFPSLPPVRASPFHCSIINRALRHGQQPSAMSHIRTLSLQAGQNY